MDRNTLALYNALAHLEDEMKSVEANLLPAENGATDIDGIKTKIAAISADLDSLRENGYPVHEAAKTAKETREKAIAAAAAAAAPQGVPGV